MKAWMFYAISLATIASFCMLAGLTVYTLLYVGGVIGR